jgi:hypothetical protein
MNEPISQSSPTLPPNAASLASLRSAATNGPGPIVIMSDRAGGAGPVPSHRARRNFSPGSKRRDGARCFLWTQGMALKDVSRGGPHPWNTRRANMRLCQRKRSYCIGAVRPAHEGRSHPTADPGCCVAGCAVPLGKWTRRRRWRTPLHWPLVLIAGSATHPLSGAVHLPPVEGRRDGVGSWSSSYP